MVPASMIAQAFANTFTPMCLFLIWFGTIIGIIFGSIPGLSAAGDLRNPLADLTKRGYRKELRNQLNSNIRLTQDLGFFDWSKGLTELTLMWTSLFR